MRVGRIGEGSEHVRAWEKMAGCWFLPQACPFILATLLSQGGVCVFVHGEIQLLGSIIIVCFVKSFVSGPRESLWSCVYQFVVISVFSLSFHLSC